MSSTLFACLLALSLAWPASAQPPAPKRPVKRAPAAVKPAGKTTEPPPAPAPPPPPPTDVKIHTKYITGAQISENTTYFKGVRQRFEFPGITMISQCDLKRSVQLHDATKHFMVVSTETPVPQAAAATAPVPEAPSAAQLSQMPAKGGPSAAQPKPKGGVIAETMTLVDTGERKQLFGLEARHVKTVTVRQPGPNACDSKTTRVETDGWYADLPERASCPSTSAPTTAPAAADPQACTDRVETQQVGTAKLGFALSTAMTTTIVDGKETDVASTSVEVTDLQVTSLDAALFDVPPGYTEVTNYQQLLPTLSSGGSLADAVFGSIADGTSSVAPKKPGVIRIGIVDPMNKSGRTVPVSMLRGGLTATFNKAPFEALQVAGATPADLDRDAAAKACDFILVSELAELKTSKPNKVGGLLRRASGDTPSDVHDARVEYKLYAVGDPAKPKVSASAKESSGGFGLSSALRIAAFAGSMYMTMGMGTGMMMSMMGPGGSLGGVGGLGGGGMSGMGAAMSMLSNAQMMGGMGAISGMPGMEDASNQKAVQTAEEALSKAAKQVAEELKKGRSPAPPVK